jgi:hypothetical protein
VSHIPDNKIYLAYDGDTNKYYITTTFKNIDEKDDWCEALKVFKTEESKIKKGACDYEICYVFRE